MFAVYAAGPTATYIPGRLLASGNSLSTRRVKYNVNMKNAIVHPRPANVMLPMKMGRPADGRWLFSNVDPSGPRMRKGYTGRIHAGIASVTGSCSRPKITWYWKTATNMTPAA